MFCAAVLVMTIITCTTSPAPEAPVVAEAAVVNAPGEQSLDSAIQEISAWFAGQLPAGTKIAITGVDAQTSVLSGYIIQELWQQLQKPEKFVMIDRQNLASIQNELIYQALGDVVDNPGEEAQKIGHFLGAECIIYGDVQPFGDGYRMSLYASRPELGTSLQQVKNIRLEGRFLPEKTLDAAIERAVTELGRNLTARVRVGIDKISYRRYETVSDFSDYLKKNISYKAVQQNKYQIVDEGEVAALIGGSFYPQADGVAVMLQMVSLIDNSVIGASKFTIEQSELDRNHLSVLPPNTTQTDLDRVYRAINPYDGKNNTFSFTIRPERPGAIYYDGDTLSFRIYSAKDCYFKITTVNVSGMQEVIYPVSRTDDNFIKAGETRVIPGGEGFTIDLHEPFGVEYVLAAAYDEQFARVQEKASPVTGQSIREGLAVRGASRRDTAEGSVTTNTSLSPSATAKFSYTLLAQ
jgi:TolB-like protein